ncbi:MAG TPA: carboxylating nicotinate-nucleotide diphosphorylase [Dehalococcoidia bacterium]|nr:carboxylating nicotinate-nucleotide diphosphorylase [Dehalococcoidia bacterium]
MRDRLDEIPFPDPGQVYDLVRAALVEDGAFRDVTTSAIVPPDQQGRGNFLAKESGVICGLTVATTAFTAVDPEIELRTRVVDGDWVHAGTEFASVVGPLGAILSAERVALNFLQRLSGIATTTRAFVQAVAGLPVRVLDTRKTTPGLRVLERYAVRMGGGFNHRFNLADGVLIKDNHIAAGRSRGLSIPDVIKRARDLSPHTLRVEIEVTTLEEAQQAIEGGADIVLLDNMPPPLMAQIVEMARGRCLFEASGGVTLENIREIAETGVDFVSSGSLTHSARALDISLEVMTAEL